MSTTKYSPYPPRPFETGPVPSADADVVEEDVAVGMPHSGCNRLVQPEPRSGVGAALHDEHCRATRRPFLPHARLDDGIGRSVGVAEEVGAESRGDVRGGFVGRLLVVRVAHLLVLTALGVGSSATSLFGRYLAAQLRGRMPRDAMLGELLYRSSYRPLALAVWAVGGDRVLNQNAYLPRSGRDMRAAN